MCMKGSLYGWVGAYMNGTAEAAVEPIIVQILEPKSVARRFFKRSGMSANWSVCKRVCQFVT